MAPQWTATNGPSGCAPNWWSARATSSLPVPVSPRTRTVTGQPRDARDGVVDLDHRGVRADDEASRPVRVHRLASRRGRCEGGRDPPEEVREVERLGDVVRHAEAGGDRRGLDRSPRRHQDDLRGLRPFAQAGEEREAVLARHVDVGEDEVDRPLRQQGHRLGDARGAADVVPRLLEGEGRRFADGGVVVNDQDRGQCPAPSLLCTSRSAGRTTSKTLPVPSAPLTETRPRCQVTTSWTSERPSPSPSAPPAPLPRTNLPKTRSRSASGIPGPSSATVRSASPSRRATAIRTREEGGENFSALETRLSTTRARKPSSPRTKTPSPASAETRPGAPAPIAAARRAASAPRSTGRAVASKLREAHLLHRVQRLDHPAEPLRLLAHHRDDARALRRREVEAGEELREAPDGREGRLHLVDGDASRLELLGPESGAAGRLPLAEARGARLHREEHEERGAGERGDRQLDPRRQERRAEAERHEREGAEEEAPARARLRPARRASPAIAEARRPEANGGTGLRSPPARRHEAVAAWTRTPGSGVPDGEPGVTNRSPSPAAVTPRKTTRPRRVPSARPARRSAAPTTGTPAGR